MWILGFFYYMITELELLFKGLQASNEESRIEEQEKRYYYYMGEESQILNYIDDKLGVIYGDDREISELVKDYINITKKIVNQLAVVYQNAPSREVFINGEVNEDLTNYYNNILPVKVSTKFRKAHRLAKLQNTLITRIGFNQTTGKTEHYIESPHKYVVVPDDTDTHKIKEVRWQRVFDKEVYTIIQNAEEYYRVNSRDQAEVLPGFNDFANPYGRVTFAKLELEEGEDIWGSGQNDIVQSNEIINLLLTDLYNEQILMGTTGTLIAVNLNLTKKGKEESGIRRVQVGRRHPLAVDGVEDNEKEPRLEHVTTNPFIEEVLGTIDWRIKTIAAFKGLDANTVLSQMKDTSDYQKMVDRLNQVEVRRDDIEPCLEYEKEVFEITRTVNNVHKEFREGKQYKLKTIPEDAEIKIDFTEIEMPLTPEQEMKKMEFELKNNLTTPIKYLIDKNPDLTKDEAIEVYNDNKKLNQQLSGSSIFRDLLQNESED